VRGRVGGCPGSWAGDSNAWGVDGGPAGLGGSESGCGSGTVVGLLCMVSLVWFVDGSTEKVEN
jgi:hypothetical protein